MPDARRKYDWSAIRDFYDAGHSPRECQQEFQISNGAWHAAVRRGDVVVRSEDRALRPRGATRARVAELLSSGLTQAEVSDRLCVSRATVCFHARALGLAARSEFARRYDWDAISVFYEEGHSARATMEHFGFSRTAWADAIKRGVIVPRPRTLSTVSILESGLRFNRYHLKSRLLREGLKHARCEDCGIERWRGKPVVLELHHINGDGRDNRLENLRLLCPNCHSQTDSWGGRNKGRLVRAP